MLSWRRSSTHSDPISASQSRCGILGSGLVLSPDGGTGTLILRDVAAMPRNDQHRLCDWLAVTAGRTRVVSTTRQPLFPLLEAGTFVETLYYRLNVLCFQLNEFER